MIRKFCVRIPQEILVLLPDLNFFRYSFLAQNCEFFAFLTYVQFIYHYIIYNQLQIIYCWFEWLIPGVLKPQGGSNMAIQWKWINFFKSSFYFHSSIVVGDELQWTLFLNFEIYVYGDRILGTLGWSQYWPIVKMYWLNDISFCPITVPKDKLFKFIMFCI